MSRTIVDRPLFGAKPAAIMTELAQRHFSISPIDHGPQLTSGAGHFWTDPASANIGWGGSGGAGITPNGAEARWAEWETGPLKSGTWKATLFGGSGQDRGIVSCSINGTLVGSTVDTYANAAYNAVGSKAVFAGWVLAAPGPVKVRFTIAGKRAAATNYWVDTLFITLDRTGA